MHDHRLSAALIAATLLASVAAEAADAPLTFVPSTDGKGALQKPRMGTRVPPAQIHQMSASKADDGTVHLDCQAVPNPAAERADDRNGPIARQQEQK